MTTKKNPPWSWKWMVAAGAAAVGAIVLITGDAGEVTPPSELIGTWQTNNSNYQDCALKINESDIVIEAADGNAYLYTVKSIEKITMAGKTMYAIVCENSLGLEFIFWFNIDSSPAGPALSFKNRPQVIWYKTG